MSDVEGMRSVLQVIKSMHRQVDWGYASSPTKYGCSVCGEGNQPCATRALAVSALNAYDESQNTRVKP